MEPIFEPFGGFPLYQRGYREYCINFLKEKGYIVSEEFDHNCFYYKISFNVKEDK